MERREGLDLLGACGSQGREARLTRYLLDTSVLIAHVRGDNATRLIVDGLVGRGHSLGISCINIAEIERGIRPRERKTADKLLGRLNYLATSKEAAARAGRYQATLAARGKTLHLADAIIAGTARAHGAVLVTHNVDDFPMSDLRVRHPSAI